jgi:hypothetical protein
MGYQRRIQRGGSLFKGIIKIQKQEKQTSIELGKECLKGKVIGGSRSMCVCVYIYIYTHLYTHIFIFKK